MSEAPPTESVLVERSARAMDLHQWAERCRTERTNCVRLYEADAVDAMRNAVEAICQMRATTPITRARLRYALAGIDWRKAK